jgi:hypothetical protein
MRAALVFILMATLICVCGGAVAGGRSNYTAPRDTIGWWIDDGAVPRAFVDTTLRGAVDISGLRALHFPDDHGGYQRAAYDGQTTSIGSAGYDISLGTSYVRLPNAQFSRIRLSCADFFEMDSSGLADRTGETDVQEFSITLVAHGRMTISPQGAGSVLIQLLVTDRNNPAHSAARSLRPALVSPLSPADTISIPWRSRAGDRFEVRMTVDASGHNLDFRDDRISLGTVLLFEGLLNGVAVRSVRVPLPPQHRIGDSIKQIYR